MFRDTVEELRTSPSLTACQEFIDVISRCRCLGPTTCCVLQRPVEVKVVKKFFVLPVRLNFPMD